MKLHTTYCSKNLACPACKSGNVVLVFLKHDKISEIINIIEHGKVTLVSSDKAEWLCKNCYDVGEIANT